MPKINENGPVGIVEEEIPVGAVLQYIPFAVWFLKNQALLVFQNNVPSFFGAIFPNKGFEAVWSVIGFVFQRILRQTLR